MAMVLLHPENLKFLPPVGQAGKISNRLFKKLSSTQ
jgi:hypothetical protein